METYKKVQSAAAEPIVDIDFTVDCSQTKFGETLKVTGNSEELGNWNPALAVGLKTEPGLFPKWKGSVRLSKAPAKIEYKYLIVRESDGHVI